jgi:hypothetical protein
MSVTFRTLRTLCAGAACVLLLAGARPASADMIITVGPSPAGDVDNMLFNEPGLERGPALTVEGIVNDVIFNIEGLVPLVTPSAGQARVEAADETDQFLWASIYAADPGVYFERFVANLQFFATTTGFATVTGSNQFGEEEELTFPVGMGENFFRVTAIDPQLLASILITTTVDMMDIRQIRIGGIQAAQIPISEPATLLLVGVGLIAAARRHRKSRS